jgi:hypothetical protein
VHDDIRTFGIHNAIYDLRRATPPEPPFKTDLSGIGLAAIYGKVPRLLPTCPRSSIRADTIDLIATAMRVRS